ncbi:MAG: hypothetical protein KKD74_12545 [Bacteroidetes bacterium]|nr:hypothetical protein [Bacteroidota bacterium]
MKKLSFLLLFAALTFLFIWSCKKEFSRDESDHSKTKTYSVAALALHQKLLEFKTTLHSDLKSAEVFDLDTAVWYIGTMFNVEKAYTTEPFRRVRRDTVSYQIDLNNDGLVTVSDMNNLYNHMIADLQNFDEEINDPDVLPVYGNLRIIQTAQNYAILRMTYGWGIYYTYPYDPFYSDDNWRYGNMIGRCDGTGQWQSDGGQELELRLNDPYFEYPTPGSFVNPVFRDIPPKTYPDIYIEHPQPDSVDYLIYYQVTSGFLGCLEYDELEFYLTKMHQIIYTFDDTYLPNNDSLFGKRPRGKFFESIDYWTPDSIYGTEHKYMHYPSVVYSDRVDVPPLIIE